MLNTTLYYEQCQHWPRAGKHILARYDHESIIVYQAYKPSIAAFTLDNQRFGGEEFSYARISWIKTNFMWMMYRCNWCQNLNQERVLAIRLSLKFFNELLAKSVLTSYAANQFVSLKAWQTAFQNSCVRMQWDPDHNPNGGALKRRAIQLGLKGCVLVRYGQTEILQIEDITPFVVEQRSYKTTPQLLTPVEKVYVPQDMAIGSWIGLDIL